MINDIKEALKYAPPGPWEVKYENYLPQIETLNGQLLALVRSELRRSTIAHLIANSPTYIRYLLDELEKEQRGFEFALNSHRYVEGELEKAQKENDKLKEALKELAK